MKIAICPICGGDNLLHVIDFEREPPSFIECLDCNQEIIPLVTPQEER